MTDEKPRAERLAPLRLEAQHATAYWRGGFGFYRIELREITVCVAPYAQYAAAVQVRCTEKGKRTRKGCWLTDRDGIGLVVVQGHGHPQVDPRHDVQPSETPGVAVKKTRWSCFAPEWSEDFAAQLDGYLSSKTVLGDYRSHDVTGGARYRELRAGAELSAGDRVLVPHGNGLIVKLRRDAAHRVEAMQVRLDRPWNTNEGHLEWVPAELCRWEGERASEVAV